MLFSESPKFYFFDYVKSQICCIWNPLVEWALKFFSFSTQYGAIFAVIYATQFLTKFNQLRL